MKSLTKTSFTNCEGKKSLLSIICIICKSFLIFHVSRVNNPRTCCIFTTKVFPILLYPCITRRNRSNGTKTINELQRCLWSTLFSTWFVSSSSFFFFHPPNYRSLESSAGRENIHETRFLLVENDVATMEPRKHSRYSKRGDKLIRIKVTRPRGKRQRGFGWSTRNDRPVQRIRPLLARDLR